MSLIFGNHFIRFTLNQGLKLVLANSQVAGRWLNMIASHLFYWWNILLNPVF